MYELCVCVKISSLSIYFGVVVVAFVIVATAITTAIVRFQVSIVNTQRAAILWQVLSNTMCVFVRYHYNLAILIW